MRFPNFAHRIGIRLIERSAVRRLRICITMTERLDQVALDRRCVRGVLLGERKAPSTRAPRPAAARAGN